MSQENRDMRMSEAEKKAAALPPKLTVPMILFFLPVLFVVILGPAAIRVMATQDSNSTAGCQAEVAAIERSIRSRWSARAASCACSFSSRSAAPASGAR